MPDCVLGEGHILAEDTVILIPDLIAVPFCLLDDKAAVSQQVASLHVLI